MKKLIILCSLLLVGCGSNDIDNIEVSLPDSTVEVNLSQIEDDTTDEISEEQSEATVDEPTEIEESTVDDKNFEDLTRDDILWLQESLKIAGFYTVRDGGFGPKTKDTLSQFQLSNGLTETASYLETVKLLQKHRDEKIAPDFGSDLVLLNKNYYLPSSFVPDDLREVSVNKNKSIELPSHVADHVEAMFADAIADGIVIYLASGYRSYDYQEGIFSRRVANKGFDEAQTVVAIPGQSEHQTGLAIDVTSENMNFGLDQSFDQDPVYEWMMANSYKYGFVLRYLKGREDDTGYIYEPWHYRYVGDVEMAKKIMESGMILEEYFKD
ncbi:MAG: D-alanyl-D-alanine carboxypeptidase family protein [Clostridiales bacterium]|nr:D-alanyl-D-alanine carboxypeptidase family protein [Clostridiales bacterium]